MKFIAALFSLGSRKRAELERKEALENCMDSNKEMARLVASSLMDDVTKSIVRTQLFLQRGNLNFLLGRDS